MKFLRRSTNSKRARTESNKKPLLQNKLPKMLNSENNNKHYSLMLRNMSKIFLLRFNTLNHKCWRQISQRKRWHQMLLNLKDSSQQKLLLKEKSVTQRENSPELMLNRREPNWSRLKPKQLTKLWNFSIDFIQRSNQSWIKFTHSMSKLMQIMQEMKKIHPMTQKQITKKFTLK